MKTEALKQALDQHGFDAAFGGARRDEEKSRAKERIFSFRSASHAWDPKNQRPELWRLYNTRVKTGESIRVFPLSNWTELDIWQYILRENIPIVPLYFAAERPVVRAQRPADHGRRRAHAAGARRECRRCGCVRFRTLGCYPLTGAIESNATLARGDRRGDVRGAHLRAAGPPDRPRRGRARWRRRSARAISDEQGSASRCEAVSACRRAPTRPAALPHLRQRRRRQVDADRPAALRFQAAVRGPARRPEEPIPRSYGTTGDEIDFALLVDGLEAEREQGITIDVAYRYFATPRRRFIVADTPGHVQYTRNMATGASTADLAILLVDAQKGMLTQTRRHAYIVSLLGIRHVVLAVNKIDLVGFDEEPLPSTSRDDFAAFAAPLGIDNVTAIPISARSRRQRHRAGARARRGMRGPTLLEHLETVARRGRAGGGPFRLPVQWVNRPNADFRGYAGTVASGRVRRGDEVVVAASGPHEPHRRASLVGADEREAAVAGAVGRR